jgi:hypothetical protein
MEQVPHIAMYCQEVPEHLHHVVPAHLLPLVVKFLTDTNNQVRLLFSQCNGAFNLLFTLFRVSDPGFIVSVSAF